MTKLPELCYTTLPTDDSIIIVKKGETGYYPYKACEGDTSDKLNEGIGVTKGQAEAMRAGSMFGWDTPAANPDLYDDEGRIKG